MRFSLFSILAAVPALALPAVPRDAEPGCRDASSSNFGWTIDGLRFHASYIFTTPAHQNSWGYLDFNLTNPALDYPVRCAASSSRVGDFFYGDVAFECEAPENKTAVTSFSFNRADGQLGLNQTWTCSDRNPKYPTRFTGYGIQDLVLDCSDVTVQNHNWTIGQIYSTRTVECQPQTFVLKPERMNMVA